MILHWRQTDLKHGIHPDAQFDIEYDDGTAHFFLEVERAKIGGYKNGKPSIVLNMHRYYDVYNTAQCENEWGFRIFRSFAWQRSITCSLLLSAG
jgi:hypothetical protein